MEDVVIVGAARTPIGKFNGAFASLTATQLGAAAIHAAVERAQVDPASVSECIMGNVVGAGLGQAPARQAAIGAGLPETVGALTINKVCGSGMKAAMLGAALIRGGDAEVIVAGGMENMSRVPYFLPNARHGYRLGNGELVDALVHDGLWCPFEHHHMGNSAEWIAQNDHVTREQQDAFAFQSQQRAIAAMDAGRLRDEIAPVAVPGPKGKSLMVDTDENPRRDTTLAALAKLRPAFAAEGTVTAGNAPGITDGAAALVLMGESRAAALGLTPLARIAGYAQAAVKPLELFTAPAFAVERLHAARRHHGRRLRPVRDQRGLRRPGGRQRARPRHRPRPAERQRRGDRPWPPDRGQRRPRDRHPDQRPAPARRPARPGGPLPRRRRGGRYGGRASLGLAP